jgi:hypothetical protein
LFFLAIDIAFVVLPLVFVAVYLRFRIQYPITIEQFGELTRMPKEFCEQIQAAGNLDRYMRSTQDLNNQIVADVVQMNAFTSAFGEFYNLLNQKELFDNRHIVECVSMWKNTAFGNETGSFEMNAGIKTITIPKNWKSIASTMQPGIFVCFCSITAKILVDILYPVLMLSTLPCSQNQRTYNIVVICWSVFSLTKVLYNGFKNMSCISKHIEE